MYEHEESKATCESALQERLDYLSTKWHWSFPNRFQEKGTKAETNVEAIVEATKNAEEMMEKKYEGVRNGACAVQE